MPQIVRRLDRHDAREFQEIELESLRHYPAAFSASYDDERVVPREAVGRRLEQATVFGGFAEGDLGAIATYHRGVLRKRAHVGMVSGMYVRDRYRGRGLARAVLTRVISHAAQEVDQLELFVAIGNDRARHFYDRFGFRPYGRMQRALRVGDVDYDADMLVLTFR
ncbi:MAG: GNAT family N-acetyltransferase [Candidatus Dormibacteraceae bacterium]